MNAIPHGKERNLSLDILRVLAIFLVLWQHASECYYIGPNVSLIKESVPVVGIFNSYSRVCIGLFIMISGYLLLPMRQTTGKFFRHRFARVLFPWLFWCVVYAVYLGLTSGGGALGVMDNIAHIPVNFGTDVGHLWYVYMLLGVYLLVPIISPWLRSCSKRELQFYLCLWGITLFLPYLHQIWPKMWGECTWNPTSTLYYFTGFGGYFVLGYYLKRYGLPGKLPSWTMLIVGYGITAAAFTMYGPHAHSAVDAEIPWDFCCINVAMMALGTFSLVSRLDIKNTGLVKRLVVNCSVCSYGMYLCHMLILYHMHDLAEATAMCMLAKIAFIGAGTFVLSWVAVWLLAKLPKSRWWMGV